MMIQKDLIRTGLDLKTSDEVIELLSGILHDKGYVNNDFRDAIFKREKQYPTGLSTGDSGFAIPHTDCRYVKRSAVSIGILNHPVKFGDMGNPEQSVDVDIVVMLAINNPDSVVSLLKDICLVFQDRMLVSALHSCSSNEEVADILNKKLATAVS